MAEYYYPFDTGNGASVTQVQWQRMAQYLENSGVCGGPNTGFLKVTTTGTGMSTLVAPGEAFVKGFFYYSDSPITVTHDPNTSGSPRIDLIVLRLDTVARTITVAAPIKGTPGATPVAPSPTFPSTIGNQVYEIPLAQVRVETGATAITADKVTDSRQLTAGSTSGYVTYTPTPSYNPGGWTVFGRYNQLAAGSVHVWGFAKYLGTPQSGGNAVNISVNLPFPAANLTYSQTMNLTLSSSSNAAVGTALSQVQANSNQLEFWFMNPSVNYLTQKNSVQLGTNEIYRWNGTYEIAGA